jgi:CO dehydrogenase maturation factor
LLGSAAFGEAIVVADLEAGIGTLTRLDAGAIDVVLVVVEPTPKSLEVGARALALARRAGARLIVVANRVQGDDDLRRVHAAFPDAEIVVVPHDEAVVEADRRGVAPLDVAPDAPAVRALVALADRLGA